MSRTKWQRFVSAVAVAGAMAASGFTVHAGGSSSTDDRDDQDSARPRKVFVIAMENHNWTQPGGPGTGNPQQIFRNPAAPFINSLADGTSGISDQVAYATRYLNARVGVHPSEPNYVWAEAGQAFDTLGTDADPYNNNVACLPQTVINSDQHLSAFLTKAGKTWRSYQEDANINTTNNVPLARAMWTVPLFSRSGFFTPPPAGGINEYNYSAQLNYAPKHNPQVLFRDTNGGCPATHSTQYPPLPQLAKDLQSNHVADYTWITPDQFNDQHTRLAAGYGVFVPATDQSAVAQGDNFLARVVPLIMASRAYEEGAAIILWWDESEGGDTADFTIPFFVISKHAHKNVGGKPFASNVELSHSSFLRTMQEIFNVDPDEGFPFLGDAAIANDASSLFEPGAIK